MKKTFKLTLILVLPVVIAMVLSGCFSKPTPLANLNKNVNQAEEQTSEEIDISDWLTYRNEEYGFEFRYPDKYEFFIEESLVNGYNLIDISQPDPDKVYDDIPVFSIMVMENIFNDQLIDWLHRVIDPTKTLIESKVLVQEKNNNGIEMLARHYNVPPPNEYTDQVGPLQVNYFLYFEKIVLSFFCNGQDNYLSKYNIDFKKKNEIMKKIINSFKKI